MTEGEVVSWYVVAKEPPDYMRTDVIGPFNSETDARAFAMDLADDNGWESIDARMMTIEEASAMTTDKITYPYTKDE